MLSNPEQFLTGNPGDFIKEFAKSFIRILLDTFPSVSEKLTYLNILHDITSDMIVEVNMPTMTVNDYGYEQPKLLELPEILDGANTVAPSILSDPEVQWHAENDVNEE